MSMPPLGYGSPPQAQIAQPQYMYMQPNANAGFYPHQAIGGWVKMMSINISDQHNLSTHIVNTS